MTRTSLFKLAILLSHGVLLLFIIYFLFLHHDLTNLEIGDLEKLITSISTCSGYKSLGTFFFKSIPSKFFLLSVG